MNAREDKLLKAALAVLLPTWAVLAVLTGHFVAGAAACIVAGAGLGALFVPPGGAR